MSKETDTLIALFELLEKLGRTGARIGRHIEKIEADGEETDHLTLRSATDRISGKMVDICAYVSLLEQTFAGSVDEEEWIRDMLGRTIGDC